MLNIPAVSSMVESDEFCELFEACTNDSFDIEKDRINDDFITLSQTGIGDVYQIADYLGLSIRQFGWLITRNPTLVAIYRKERVISKMRLTNNMKDIAENAKYTTDKFSATKYLLGALHELDEQMLRLKISNQRDEKKYKLDKKKYMHEVKSSSNRNALDVAKSIKSMDDSSLERLFKMSSANDTKTLSEA
jgi:hypothetical protein